MVQEEASQIDPNNKDARFIARNHSDLHMKRFASNAIHTGKYDRLFITFLPIFLWDTFTRLVYLYFLTQVRWATCTGLTCVWSSSTGCSTCQG